MTLPRYSDTAYSYDQFQVLGFRFSMNEYQKSRFDLGGQNQFDALQYYQLNAVGSKLSPLDLERELKKKLTSSNVEGFRFFFF